MVKSMFLLFYLIVLSIFDWREKKVPVVLLAAGTAVAAGYGLHVCVEEAGNPAANMAGLCLGIVPGCFLLLLARLTGKVGYGDGVVMMIVGLTMGYQSCFALLCFSLFLAAVISVALLLLRRADRRTALPYLPFLTAVYLAGFLI